MESRILYIKLNGLPFVSNCNRYQGRTVHKSNRSESSVIISVILLLKTSSNQMRFVVLNESIEQVHLIDQSKVIGTA